MIAKKQEMPKNFDFTEAETRLYDWWEKNGWFKPEARPDDAEPFVISMPPPNVTGKLHIGHALFTSLEDLMTRYERMRGKAALWVPGTDHAGIATQLQVEKQLADEGLSRFDVGREGTKHVAFGYGIHFCLGAPLARLEGAVAVNTLVNRLPDMRLDTDQLVWRHDVAIRSLQRLPVRF